MLTPAERDEYFRGAPSEICRLCKGHGGWQTSPATYWYDGDYADCPQCDTVGYVATGAINEELEEPAHAGDYL